MDLLKKLINFLFKPEPKLYAYYKRVRNSHYGLCGQVREYRKVELSSGRYGPLDDIFTLRSVEVEGFKPCTKLEYEKFTNET